MGFFASACHDVFAYVRWVSHRLSESASKSASAFN